MNYLLTTYFATPVLPYSSTVYLQCFLFISVTEAIETLLATTRVTACSPATIAILESPTTIRPKASEVSISKSSEDDLAQVEEVVDGREI